MTLTSTLSGAQLAFKAERIDIPLGKLVQHGLKATGGESVAPPKFRPPRIEADDFTLNPVRVMALKEIIRHASSGTARITLPFPLREIDAKVTTVEVPPETVVQIDVVLEDAAVIRKETTGSIVPPLALPLGFEARGVTIDDNGDVHVVLSGLPDLNLTKRGLLPNIPASLDELLPRIFPEPSTDPEDDAETTNPGVEVDLTKLVVEARDVVPRPERFSLGSAGDVEVGGGTKLDVDFSHDRLAARGRVQVEDAQLRGAAFLLTGLKGEADVQVDLVGPEGQRLLRAQVDCIGAELGPSQFKLADGTRIDVASAKIGAAQIEVEQSREGLRFSVVIEQMTAQLERAVVVAHIGESSSTIEVGPFVVEGSAKLSERHGDVDVSVAGAELLLGWLDLDLDVVELALSPIEAKANGHLKAGTDYGFSFSGELAVNAEVASGMVIVDELRAHIAPKSKLNLALTAVGAGPDGLDIVEGSGQLDLRLGSGSIPLGPATRVSFSEGALGTVRFDEIAYAPGARWPLVRGAGHIVADSDPVRMEPLVELPKGRASLDASFAIDAEAGHLVVTDLGMRLVSREDE